MVARTDTELQIMRFISLMAVTLKFHILPILAPAQMTISLWFQVDSLNLGDNYMISETGGGVTN